MSEEILYKLRIEGTDKALNELKDLTTEIDNNKKAIKEAGDVSSKENEERKVNLKSQQQEYRKLQAAVKDRNKAEEEGAKTLEKMRAQLRNLNKEMDKTPLNSKRFKDLTAQSKKLRDEIKGADEATGRFQGNVGNYKNAITDAFRQMGVNVGGLTTAIGTASTGMKGLSAATGGSTKAMKIFRLALISTGIGAIVVAVGALVAAFLSTQKGVDAVNKVLIPLKTIFEKLIGLVQDISVSIYDAFTNPKQAIKDLWDTIKTNIINRFTGFIDQWKALGKVIKGVFTFDWDAVNEGAKEFGESSVQMLTGVDNLVGKVKSGFNALGEEISNAADEGARLAQITIDIDNARIKLAENEGRITREMIEQRAILENVNKSDKERKEAGEKFLKLQDELLNYKKDIADLELEQATIKAKQNDTDREAQLELAQLSEKKNALEAESLKKAITIKNKLNSIEKKANDERIKEIEYREDLEQGILDNINSQIDALIAANNKLIKESLEGLDDPDIEEEEDEGLKLIEQEEARAAILEEFRLQRISAEQKELENYKQLKDDQLITDEEYEEKKAEVEKKYADINKQIKKQEIDGKLSMAANGLGQLSEIAGKETKVGKAAAVAQATINTYLAASSAFASAGNPVLGAILAAIAVAAGLMQVQKIVSVKTNVPKYARGVIGLNGAGSETSDSIDAKLSRGESVMTAKATKAYAPMLADMERSVGNKPNIHLGNRKFAGGFIGGSLSPRTEYPSDYERVMEQTINNITQIPVTVTETDITSTQNKVRQIKVTGDL